jgi:acylphosphatase
VRNAVDGRVEAVACGDRKQLAEFERWLYSGPGLARVDSVLASDENCEKYNGFEIR